MYQCLSSLARRTANNTGVKSLTNEMNFLLNLLFEPVATEHQSNLLVLDVLLRKVYKFVNY